MNQFRILLRELLVAALITLLIVPLRRYVFVQLFDLRAPFFPFLCAIVLATWVAGWRAGLYATAFSAATIGYLLVRAAHFQNPPPQFYVRMLLFVAVGGATSWLTDSVWTARQRIGRRQQLLEREIAERKRAEAALREQREQLAVEIELRAAAEAALREREDRMRMAIESAAIGTWDFNPVTGARNWSERAKVMFGLPAYADVTDVTYLDRIHPDDRERAQQAVERALDASGDGRYEVDCRLLRPDNSVGWFIVKGQAFFAGEGAQRRPVRFIGTVMEITERKQIEEALRQAEERFRLLATHAPVGIFYADSRGQCHFVNDAWSDIVGATADEAMGDGWTAFLHPDDRQRVLEAWEDAMRQRRNEQTEFRFVNRATGVRWVAASVISLSDDTGDTTGYVGTIVDLTDRKAIEDVIRADEARLRSILDNTPAVISLKDLDGRYVLVNRAWEELYAVSNDQIRGLTNYDLLKMTRSSHMSPAIADQFAAVDRQVIATGAPAEFEDPVPDGEDQLVFVTVKFPITDPSGAVTGVGGITTDITERRRIFDSLKAEQELMSRTIEEQDRERQLIVYGVHDGVMAYAAGALMQLESLRLPAGNNASQEVIDNVVADLRRTVDDGRRLIDGIRTPVLDDLGVVAALEQLIYEEERAHVAVEFVKDDALERMDPKIEEAIYRITQEALTNIGKHSRTKNVRVELERRGDSVHLEVRDWGVGFMPNHTSKGTHGLLSMAERARIAGGRFSIKSAVGEGTQVSVELPFVSRY